MCSAMYTSSEGPRLVRIVVPCAQTRMAIKRHSGTKHCAFREACSYIMLSRPRATEPRAKQEMRSVLCHSLMIDSTFKQSENVAIAVVSLNSYLHRGV